MDEPPLPNPVAAYPRYGGPGSYGQGPRRVRFDAIGEAWQLCNSDWASFIGGILVLVAAALVVEAPLMFVVMGQVLASRDPTRAPQAPAFMLATVLVSVILNVVLGVLSTGIVRVAVEKARGRDAGFADIFRLSGQVVPLAGVCAILALAALLPTVAQLIVQPFLPRNAPESGLVFTLLAQGLAYVVTAAIQILSFFAPMLVVDRKLSVGQAFKESFEAARGAFWPLVGIVILAELIGILGIIVCGVGLLFTMPINYATRAIVYNDFFRAGESPSGPPTDFVNPPSYNSL